MTEMIAESETEAFIESLPIRSVDRASSIRCCYNNRFLFEQRRPLNKSWDRRL
jgi:hypothetical protein